ncbi:MerR family transcriptional regulator [Flavobacteriaceae bacterium R38]|nr:MerR family transcriptional regulator [Flavobacteriaceae bacterium R38]
MNIVKKRFSIKDLENLSGIKAHTIRIWEKRYDLLTPNRTDTNIRYYSLSNLQKLLNITLLYNNGYKISKIAKVPEKEIPLLVREIISENTVKSHSINAFKLAMINFDQTLFLNTYNALLANRTFKEIFQEVLIPLLTELGLLWQTDVINPSHEHFVIGLIKQKILVNIERLQVIEASKKDKVFVLFLPESEIHEIGLLYLNYEIALKGYQSIYLGQSVPLDSLIELPKYFSNIVFLSYFTVEPNKTMIDNYIKDFYNQLHLSENNELWVLGQQVKHLKLDNLQEEVKVFGTIEEVINEI